MSVRDARTLKLAIDSTYEAALVSSDENQTRLAQLMAIWVSGYTVKAQFDDSRQLAEKLKELFGADT